MLKTEWFKNWFNSPYYHLLYNNRDEDEAKRFTNRLLEYLSPPAGCRMVDIACGEGRFSIELAGKGYDVTGIDLATASIEKAKAHENDHLHFFVHDMRLPFYINYFDYAFNFFTSFGYFATRRDHEAAAKQFANCLKKDGILVIDYLNADLILKKLVPDELIKRDGIEFCIHRQLKNERFEKEISFKDKAGTEHCYQERVAAFSKEDFLCIFEHTGMTLTATFGDYDLNPFNKETSPRLILIFKKTEHVASPS